MLGLIKSLCIRIQNLKVLKDYVQALRSLQSSRLVLDRSKKEQDVYVLGNGPSLKRDIHTLLQLGHTRFVCVNNFCESSFYSLLKPSFYVLTDPAYWDDAPSLSFAEEIQRTLIALKATDWPLTLFLPDRAKQSALVRGLLSHEFVSLRFLNLRPSVGVPHFAHRFFLEKNLLMPFAANVVVAATYVAMNLGYSRVVLYGVDHTWFNQLYVDQYNIPRFSSSHFSRAEDAGSKGIAVYKDPKETQPFSMAELFEGYGCLFRAYEELAVYAGYFGVHVVNACPESAIDAFVRDGVL